MQLNIDDALKMLGYQVLELRMKDQQIEAYLNTIKRTEEEVVKLREEKAVAELAVAVLQNGQSALTSSHV